MTLTAKFEPVKYTRLILNLILLGAVSLGALHAWAAASNQSMNEDGISYLDIGDAIWRGDWEQALNPVWSPLYPLILGGALRLFQPDMYGEFPLVHGVNFAIYLLALASFAYFWKQVDLARQHRLKPEDPPQTGFPDWVFYGFGYLLFTWSSLVLIEIWAVTPDMLMSALVYLAGGLLLKVSRGQSKPASYALLGLVLGLGFLAKTIMLPISFLFLGACLLSTGNLRRKIPRVGVALLVFLLMTGPYILRITQASGHFTYGESGFITYLRHVNQVPFPHWQGDPAKDNLPFHPSRQIFTQPRIFEFGSPIGGTYPISFDPSYWYAGVRPDYSLQAIIPGFLTNLLVYFELFCSDLGLVVGSYLVLILVAARKGWPARQRPGDWSLAIIAILVLGLYSLVYVSGRYIAIGVILLFADLTANLALPDRPIYRRLILAASAVMLLGLLGNLLAVNLEGLTQLIAKSEPQASGTTGAPMPAWPGEVAEELQNLGVRPGEPVAVIGYAYSAFWARLARVKIIAEMLDTDASAFWYGTAELKQTVIQAFRSTGARAIVGESVPDGAGTDSWRQVGDTNVYIYLFNE